MDELAIRATLALERYSSLIDIGIAGVFAVIGIILNRSPVTIHRSTYLVLWGIVLILTNSVGLSVFFMKDAILAGVWWLLILLNLLAGVVGGLAQGYLAAARSRDFSSHKWWGLLIAIPVINLVLTLIKPKPGRVDTISERYPIVAGWSGVFIGVVLIIASIAVFRISDEELDFSVEDPDDIRAGMIMGVQAFGLAGFLQQIATESGNDLPLIVDEYVTLTRIEAVGTELRRVYFMKYEGGKLDAEGKARIVQLTCAEPIDRELLSFGASIRESYVLSTGAPFGDVVVTAADCP